MAPFFQFQHLLYAFGGFLAPWISAPFTEDILLPLDKHELQLNNNRPTSLCSDYPNITMQTVYSNLINRSINNNASTTLSGFNQTACNISNIYQYTDLKYVYSIQGCYMFVAAIACFVFVLSSGTFRNTLRVGPDSSDASVDKTDNKQNNRCKTCCIVTKSDLIKLSKIVIFTIFMTMQLAVEYSVSGLIVTFVVKHYQLTKSLAALLMSMYFLINTITRFIMVFILRCVHVLPVITCGLVMLTCSVAVLVIFVNEHVLTVWVSVLTMAATFAALGPTILAWASMEVQLTGRVASVFMIPFSGSLFLGPPVIAHFFENEGSIWFTYMIGVYTVIVDVLFIIAWLLTRTFHKIEQQEKMKCVDNKC